MSKSTQSFRRCRSLPGVLAVWLLLVLLVLPGPLQAAVGIQRWSLTDELGDRWQISLFEQPDPDFQAGWRLRLNALGAAQHPDQQRPLLLQEAMGGQWQLANRSEELVPSGSVEIPLGSAQFELTGLTPIPSAEIPLRLAVPMATGADHGVMLTPELVAALHSVLQ